MTTLILHNYVRRDNMRLGTANSDFELFFSTFIKTLTSNKIFNDSMACRGSFHVYSMAVYHFYYLS